MTNPWHSYPTNYTDPITNLSTSVGGVGDFFGSYPASVVPFAGVGIVILLWIVSFSLSLMSGTRKAFMVASFITGVLSVYLWRIGMIDVSVVFILVVLTIVGALGGKEENAL